MHNIGESSVRLPKTSQRINTALRHNTDAGSKKTAVFFWLDQGLMRMAGRYLAEYKLGFKSGSVRVYVREWNKQTAVVSTELRLGSWTRKTRNNTKAAMI